MQSAKDTFYGMLRDRIAAGNAERTVVIRGVSRPGVVVEENELVSAVEPTDAFLLEWTTEAVDAKGALPLVTMGCAIHYETAGSAGNGGMDRGRMLAAMDAELLGAVSAGPQSVGKMNYAVTPAAAMATNVFWGELVLGPAVAKAGRLGRTASVAVLSYEEANEG